MLGVITLAFATEVSAIMASGTVTVSPAAVFMGLGDLPGGDFRSEAIGVSADGSVVVGCSQSGTDNSEAFRWENGVMMGLGHLPGGGLDSCASAVSADGSIIVGWSNSASGESEAFRWENDLMEGLGDLPGGEFWSRADGVSADGSVIVGSGSPAESEPLAMAVSWEDGIITPLGDPPSGDFGSNALAVSADGRVIVGGRGAPEARRTLFTAFRWVDGVMLDMDNLLNSPVSAATGVSADGSVIVGANGLFEFGPFRWEDGVALGLGFSQGGFSPIGEARGVSGDGSIVIGGLFAGGFATDFAFIWDSNNEMQLFHLVLENDFGLDMTGWTLTSATAISADARTIVGIGVNPDGATEGWIVMLPEPGKGMLEATALLTLLGLASRHRTRRTWRATSP